MAQHADMARVLASHAGEFGDDEPLLGAMSASLPKGDVVLNPRKMGRTSGFPLAAKMTLALTARRIVVYKSGWGSRVGVRLGEVPLHRVANIEITWNRKLAIVAIDLRDAPPVVMRAMDASGAEVLRNQFLHLRGRI